MRRILTAALLATAAVLPGSSARAQSGIGAVSGYPADLPFLLLGPGHRSFRHVVVLPVVVYPIDPYSASLRERRGKPGAWWFESGAAELVPAPTRESDREGLEMLRQLCAARADLCARDDPSRRGEVLTPGGHLRGRNGTRSVPDSRESEARAGLARAAHALDARTSASVAGARSWRGANSVVGVTDRS